LANRFADVVNVKDFGAVGDGITNDRAAIQLAIDSLGSAGGTVLIPNGMKCLIDLNGLIVKPNVSLVGPHKFVGSPQDNSSAPYNNIGGAIVLDAGTVGVSIYMQGGSSISGLLIYRKGMVFPVQNASAFTGTAIIASDDDVAVSHCMILGFNKAYYSTGHQRARIDYVYMDNVNGIEIDNCLDVFYISNCHAWPFASIAWGPGSIIVRNGTAYRFSNRTDWGKISNCFSYGYLTGLDADDVFTSISIVNCSFDNNLGLWSGIDLTNLTAIKIRKQSGDVRVIGCQCSAHTTGIYIDNTFANGCTTINGSSITNGTNGVFLENGNATITNCYFSQLVNSVNIQKSSSYVIFNNNFSILITGKVITSLVNNARTQFGINNTSINTFINPLQNIVSDSITPTVTGECNIPQQGSVFFVNGTNNFSKLRHGWAGRNVTLIFSSVLTVQAAGPTPAIDEMVLDAGNFTTAIGNTITLVHTGTTWYEVSRTPRNP
jgi:hypothetical protein